MSTPLDELRKSPMPLTPEAIGAAIGYSPAAVRRVVQELKLPAAYFAHCYSLPQVRIIINALNAEQIEALEKGNPHHASTSTHHRPPYVAGASEQYRESLARRREAGRKG